MTPVTTLGKLGNHREVPFLGSFTGSGSYSRLEASWILRVCKNGVGPLLTNSHEGVGLAVYIRKNAAVLLPETTKEWNLRIPLSPKPKTM